MDFDLASELEGTSPAALARMLRPRSIAVVGGQAAERVAEQCDRLGFEGEIWPVHPRRSMVAGHRAVATADELPSAPDAAFIGVNRRATIEAVAALARMGAGGAVCYASGFSEAEGGKALQDALLDAAGTMPIIGPNCYGFVNFLDGAPLWPDQHGGRRLGAQAHGVAIVTQSSNIAISMTMQRRGLPLAYVATAGNQAQIGVSALGAALLDDERVSALGLHIEGFDSAPGLEALARKARERRTPVVVLKAGRSRLAQAAALSHTASIAGSDAGANALVRRLGFARAKDMAEFLETLKLLHVHGALAGARLGAMCCSGGEAALVADAAQEAGVELPPLTPGHADAVADAVHPLVAVANPLDYHTFAWGDPDALHTTFRSFIAPGAFDAALLMLDFPRRDRCDDAEWQTTLAAFERAAADAKGLVVATLAENLPEERAEWMIEHGLAPLAGLPEALAAVANAAEIGGAWRTAPAAAILSAQAVEDAPVMVDEAQAKARLAEYGVAVPAGGVAHSVEEALAIADSLDASVAVKALGIAHKSERNAVRLGLREEAEVAAAARALLAIGGSVLVERFEGGFVAELIVGVQRDPALGLLLTVGIGGTLVELLADTETLLLPTTADEVREALGGLRGSVLLEGHRGTPKADIEAAVDAVQAIAHFAAANRATLEELDVNPLAVAAEGQGAIALDALLYSREPA